MARVRFIGPSAKRRVEFANGMAQVVSRGEIIEVSDEEAAALLNTGAPRMWEAADSGHTSPRGFSPALPKKSRMGKEEE